MATHSSILAWRIPIDRGAWWAAVHGVTKSRTRLNNKAQPRTAMCQPSSSTEDVVITKTGGPRPLRVHINGKTNIM